MDGACKEWWYKDKMMGVSKKWYFYLFQPYIFIINYRCLEDHLLIFGPNWAQNTILPFIFPFLACIWIILKTKIRIILCLRPFSFTLKICFIFNNFLLSPFEFSSSTNIAIPSFGASWQVGIGHLGAMAS